MIDGGEDDSAFHLSSFMFDKSLKDLLGIKKLKEKSR